MKIKPYPKKILMRFVEILSQYVRTEIR